MARLTRIELTGKRFGRLRVTRFSHTVCAEAHWICVCDCGTEKTISGRRMRVGKTKSCGCLHKEFVAGLGRKNARHGHAIKKTPVYNIWKGMIKRCHKPSNKSFRSYGARGIKVCERWKSNFSNFLADMGEPPPGHSIDRIDVNKGYSPDNCRWIPIANQALNRQNTFYVDHNGTRVGLAALARSRGVDPKLVKCRYLSGWSLERALSTPKLSIPS